MSNLAIEAALGPTWSASQRHIFKRVMSRSDIRVGEAATVGRLSLSSGGYLYPREGTTDRQQASESTEQRSLRVEVDELVVNPMWLTGGSIAVSGVAGAVSPDYRVFTSSARVEPRFLHHLLRSQPYRDQYDLFVRANTTFDRRIQQQDLDQMPLWLPPRDEQRRIADFLDDRVARIDQIIAARRQQLELLDSAFGSRLTNAIDDGGGVPVPLWLMTERITDGAHVSPETEDGIYDFVSTRDVDATGAIDFAGSLKTSAPSYQELVRYACQPRVGDLLFSKDGTVGRTARVTENRKFVVASSLIIISPRADRVDVNYLHYLFKHAQVVHQIEGFVRGAGLPRISITNLQRVVGLFPPLRTQRELARAMDEDSLRLHRTSGAIRASIDLLSEYKQSLITAAVTGEFDVTTAGSGIPG